jgi:F-type H+-transporting ATPase subunit delta
LTPALQEEVRQRFAHYTSKEIVIDQELDPSLIGGMVAQMGSLVLDGSIRNELLRIKTELVGDHRGGQA